MDAFPSGSGGAPPPEEDFSKMSIEDRLASKNWKARVSGYEDLGKAFERSPDESDPVFRPYTRNADAIKAMVMDSNAVAQEKALDAVKSFVQFGGKAAGQTRETVLPALIDKCFGAARAGTKKSALEIVALYAEAEDTVGCEGLVSDILRGTSAKQPKIVASSTTALANLVRDFGPKQVSFKAILKKMPDIFGHADKGVRQEAAVMAQELHKWIGSALEPTLGALKEIQARELREQFAALDAEGQKSTVPQRYLTSQQVKAASEPAQGGVALPSAAAEGRSEAADAPEVDPLEFLEPVDPLRSKLWPADFDERSRSAKWLERKEVFEECIKALEAAPKMIYTPGVDGIVDTLAEKIKKDANINVCLAACQCIARFAQGLRSDFARYKDKVLPPLLEKLKEKKESTVKVLADTLDAVFLTVSLGDILEHTLAAIKHKNPAVKSGAIQFLARCLRETRSMPAKSDVAPIAEALTTAMADGSVDVRDAGAQGLGTLMKLIGERPMNQYLDALDDIKTGKVQEQYKMATVKVKAAGPSAALAGARGNAPPKAPLPRPAAAAMAAPKPKPTTMLPPLPAEKENAPPQATMAHRVPTTPQGAAAARGPPARVALRQPPPPKSAVAGPSRPLTAAPVQGKKVGVAIPAAGAGEPVKYRMSQEDAEARAAEVVPTQVVEELSNSVWKERLAGMGKFNDWLKLEVETIEAELVVRFLAKKPGWKESNFQVMAEVYNALRMLAEDSPTFGRSSIALSITPLCEKLGDIKLKGPAGDTLTLYAEKTSLGFVLHQALAPLGSLKAPKAIADSLLWVNQALLDFGTAGVEVRGLVSHVLTCLKSANAGVRTNATLVIGTLARFLGVALTSFLGDLNPQLRTTVEAAIEKATQEPAPEPTRTSEDTRPKHASSGGEASSGGAAAASSGADKDALDALIPRVDLEKIVPSSISKKLGDANWKERKEGAEELLAILEAHSRLQPNLGDVGNALKARYADSNMQVKTMSLEALSKIATGMGKGFEQHARTFVPPVTQVLSDSKAPMRLAAAKTLTAMAEQAGVASMIPGFVSVLDSKAANPALKQDLLTWLGEWFEQHSPEKGMDLTGLALPTLSCLDDKLAAVRKAAQAVLPFIVMRAGYRFVMEQTNSLKAASRTTVIPLIDAAKIQAASKAPAAATGPPSSMVSVSKVQSGVRPAGSAHAQPAPVASTSARVAKPATVVARSLKPHGGARTLVNDTFSSGGPASAGVSLAGKVNGARAESEQGRTAPFLSSDPKGKAVRERREAARQTAYWIGPDAVARPELSEILRQQSEASLSGALLDKMFSKDHSAERDYLSALTLLADYTSNVQAAAEEFGLSEEEAGARAVANADLVLKYVAIRLTDNNTSIALKCLDTLANIIALLRAQEYHMSDYEANAILPCVISKFGDPKVAFRDQIRTDILRKLTFIYPPSKLFARLLDEGLSNKNVRVRMESLGEIGHLFQRYGMQICTLSKSLPVVAKQISDRDNGVRTAALLAVGEVYKVVGNDVWPLVGKLAPKEMSLLEERLKRTTGPTSAPSAATTATAAKVRTLSSPVRQPKPGPPASALPAPPGGLSRPIAARTAATVGAGPQSRIALPSRIGRPAGSTGIRVPSTISRATRPPAKPEASEATPELHSDLAPQSVVKSAEPPTVQAHESVRAASRATAASETSHIGLRRAAVAVAPPATAEEDAVVDIAIAEILSSESDISVGALKRIENDIQQIAPALARHADSLAVAFGKQLLRAFGNENGALNNERMKKHLLITGTSIFDNTRLWEDVNGEQRTLGSFVGKSALISILTQLLQQLIETKDAVDEETKTHGRYLNIIVLRSFSSCSLNVLFGACLSMLAEATDDLEDLRARDDSNFGKRIKFADLICKCLWKITRKLNASLTDELVDPVELLQDLEHFLQAIPPSVWKERASIEMPLGDMPLRTVKVIITHIGSVFGEGSLQLLDGFAEPEQTYVCSHLLRASGRGEGSSLEAGEGASSNEAALNVTSPPLGSTHQHRATGGSGSLDLVSGDTDPGALIRTEDAAAPSTPGASDMHAAEEAINAELRGIFDRIASKSESRAAIKDLYLFQRKYPHKESSIRRSLQQTGPIFQKFIRRALANHASEDGEPLPLLDTDDSSSHSPRRESFYGSPSGSALSPTRSSSHLDWQASAASLQRMSHLSPSPSRHALNGSSASVIGTPTPSDYRRNGGLDGPLHVRSHDDEYFRDASYSGSPASATRHSSTTMPRPRYSRESSSSSGAANEDRLAQLRAKFARPVSQIDE